MKIPSHLLPRIGPYPALSREFFWICHQRHVALTRFVLDINLPEQRLRLFEKVPLPFRSQGTRQPWYFFRGAYRVSTSRFGPGQKANSNRTPLGLHCITEKVGSGWPVGTVFESRKPVGLTWDGEPSAPIAHRILWLEGLEPHLNRGNGVDSFSRYIYIHGVGDETRLGRPASLGCIHLASADLLRLFDLLPLKSLVWLK